MSSYFRKMMNFGAPHSSAHSDSYKTASTNSPSLSYAYPTKSSAAPPPPPGYYQYATKTPMAVSRNLDSSPKAGLTFGWNEKQAARYDGPNDCGSNHGYQYPARADRSVYSHTASVTSSVSSFGTLSSSPASSSSSLASSDSYSSRKKPSSVLKGPPNSSPKLSLKSKCRVSFTNPCKAQPVHMHPLFATSRSRRAPVHYDVSTAPSAGNLLDFMKKKIPMCTLLESATEPATRGKLTITSDQFPWPIVVHASGDSTLVDTTGRPILPSPIASPSSATKPVSHSNAGSPKSSSTKSPPQKQHTFFIDSSDSDDEEDDFDSNDAVVSNLDVLCAIYDTLSRPICQDEWDELGDGDSAEQRRIARAYRRRCKETGGKLGEGVKRIDFLKGRTVLVGIESRKAGDTNWREGVMGRMVFAEEGQ